MGHLQEIDVGGIRIAYRRKGTGPALLLLHGAFQDGRYWQRQIADLSDNYDVIVPDAPGCGASDNPPPDWTTADYGNCFAGIIHALGLQSRTVLGLSFGAVCALALWQQAPDTVGALVLALPTPAGPAHSPNQKSDAA